MVADAVWNAAQRQLKAEGWSRCTIEIEPVADDAVKLTVTHQLDGEGTKFIASVSGGWPRILSNVKSLLETGELVLKVTWHGVRLSTPSHPASEVAGGSFRLRPRC